VKILATLTLTTLTVGLYAGTAAADQATCVVTAQPQNEKSYHLAYTDQEGLHTLIAHQDGRRLEPTDFEIPADFDQVLWATKQGRIDGPDSFYDRLSNGGGCTFTEPYHAQPGWRASVIIRPGHTPTTTSSTAPTTSTTAPTTTTSTTPDLPPATVPPTTTTTSPAVTTWRTTPLPDQPPVAIPPGGDVAIDPPPTTAPTPYTAVPRLPDTGRNAGMIVGWGMSVLLSGVAFLAGGRACRNRKDLK
jgi:hypothetical protein